jgi:hypothetical protein
MGVSEGMFDEEGMEGEVPSRGSHPLRTGILTYFFVSQSSSEAPLRTWNLAEQES